MLRLSYLLTASLAAIGAQASSAIINLIPDNFDKIVLESGKPALVEFFAPWCGHCKRLAPVYEELAQAYEFASDKLTIANVDADSERALGQKYGVQGFPTLKWFDGKSDTPEDYQGGRDLESLVDFISEKTGIKPRAKKGEPSEVVWLDDSTFEAAIGGDKHVIAAFTAPWCGHCKALAPTWEMLAHDFSREPNVTIAKVDAESPTSKAVAEKYEVRSYPTIIYFAARSTLAQVYDGGRSETELIEFLNGKANTHRLPGGGYDAQGGMIDILDEVVRSLASVGNVAEVYERAKKEALGLEAKYAGYYLRVFEKLTANEGYVKKELSRLEGMIKMRANTLAPAKMDDLVARSNILRLFKANAVSGHKDEL